MEVQIGRGRRLHRGASGELRFLEIDGVIVATQGELPSLVDAGPAAGAKEVAPGDAALDRPALVLVLPTVESAAQSDLGLDVEFAIILEAPVAAGAPA